MRGTLRHFMLAVGFTGLGFFLGAYASLCLTDRLVGESFQREMNQRFSREKVEAQLVACEFWRKK